MYTITSIIPIIKHIDISITDLQRGISKLAFDTRKITSPESSLFFALIGQRDGHRYLNEAYAKGVRSFVVSHTDLDISLYPDANFIWVENTMRAIQELAAYHRAQFSIPVIGITGSNGKTIVKEWLHQLLSPEYKCYQSPKSYNSQLGVALSLWELSEDYDMAIIEAGISSMGEMQYLAQMIRPTVGVFTSLGTAHREGFENKEIKLREKWSLFQHAEYVVAPSQYLNEEIRKIAPVFSWGELGSDSLCILESRIGQYESVLRVDYLQELHDIRIPFVDKASIENVMTCVSLMLKLGYDLLEITPRIMLLKPLEMRLQLKRGRRDLSIIDDTYSNDLASLQIALDFLNQQRQHDRRSLILSDFVGEEWTDKFQRKLLRILNAQSLHQVILIGQRFHALQGLTAGKVFLFDTVVDLLHYLPKLELQQETVLIKGARVFGLEKVSNLLVEKSHDTVLEINLKALENNLIEYRSRLKPGVKLMVMVKAFSYGSGSFEVANILQFNKVDYLTVAFVDEGVELREGGISLPIMVLSPHEGTFDSLVRHRLEPEIYSLRILQSFVRFLEEQGITDYPIHIKLDTGMHRLGFLPDELDALLGELKATNTVKVMSMLSHLVGAGNPDLYKYTDQQVEVFRRSADQVENKLGYNVIKHICNTSAIMARPDAHMDMVRLGIGIYGISSYPELNLEPVGALKTTITQLKDLQVGETVGYDRKGVLYRDSKIATVKIGYADGYDRRLGNGKGKMMVNGKLAPTVGNICMDMCMLDVTDIEVKEGDDVLVFPDVVQTASDIATIPYELLVGVSSRVKRVYFYE